MITPTCSCSTHVIAAVKQSTGLALTPLTMPGVNESAGFSAAAVVPQSAAAVREASAYSAPYSAAAYGVR